jgi:hypothetical protein
LSLISSSNFEFCLFQEIALLSQFEHENIVQYYGTDKALSYSFNTACLFI